MSLIYISLREIHNKPMKMEMECTLDKGVGIVGDRYYKLESTKVRKRQVTIMTIDQLCQIRKRLGKRIEFEDTRRNLLIDAQVQIGDMIAIGQSRIKIVSDCPPCKNMDDRLGEGGMKAMEGIGGFCGMIILGGIATLGMGVIVFRP